MKSFLEFITYFHRVEFILLHICRCDYILVLLRLLHQVSVLGRGLSIEEKLEAIAKVESGLSQKQLVELYCIGQQTMSDIVCLKL